MKYDSCFLSWLILFCVMSSRFFNVVATDRNFFFSRLSNIPLYKLITALFCLLTSTDKLFPYPSCGKQAAVKIEVRTDFCACPPCVSNRVHSCMLWRNTGLGGEGDALYFSGFELRVAWKADNQTLFLFSGTMQPNIQWFFLDWVTSKSIFRFGSQMWLWFRSQMWLWFFAVEWPTPMAWPVGSLSS